jgi:hypothetical protein
MQAGARYPCSKVLTIAGAALALAVLAGLTPEAQSTSGSFISPVRPPVLVAPSDPRYPDVDCRRRYGLLCPTLLVFAGRGGLPAIPPAVQADVPHLHVSFILREIRNQAVANGGLTLDQMFLEWAWDSPLPSVDQSNGRTVAPPPAPGDTLLFPSYSTIYGQTFLNACAGFTTFPIELTAKMVVSTPIFPIPDDADLLGSFHGVDHSTIDHTGFYEFAYTVRAEHEGSISDYHFWGTVSVTCITL